MEHLTRSETKLIIEGLNSVWKRMRTDTSIDLHDDPEYQTLRRLQEKLIAHLEKLPY